MKNLLSENMLRFGTKNLSEAAQRELILKSIMETINQHGLHEHVKYRLMEEPEGAFPKDPDWMKTAKNALAGENEAIRNGLAIGIIKKNSSFVNPEIIVCSGIAGRSGFHVLAKGSKFVPSPSHTVAFCPSMYFDDSSMLMSLQKSETEWDQTKLQQLLDGKYSYNGKIIKRGQLTNVFYYPSLSNLVASGGGKLYRIDPYGMDMRTTLLANASMLKAPGVAGTYTPE